MRFYKVRRKSDGLYALKKRGGGLSWNGYGSVWNGPGRLRQAMSKSLKDLRINDVEVVEVEFVEVGVCTIVLGNFNSGPNDNST